MRNQSGEGTAIWIPIYHVFWFDRDEIELKLDFCFQAPADCWVPGVS